MIKVVIDVVVSCTARHGVLCACSYRLHLIASSHGTCMRHMACCVILCWPGIFALGWRAFLMLCLTLLLSSALWRSRVPMTSLSAITAVVLCILCVETYPDTRRPLRPGCMRSCTQLCVATWAFRAIPCEQCLQPCKCICDCHINAICLCVSLVRTVQ